MSNVAFIGLGVMGYPMAGYISKAGHNVTVYNRTAAKADKWIAEYKGSKADTPAKAAEGADFVFTCVGNDNDLSDVTIGKDGIYNTIKKGAIHIDNTTASAEIARKLYKSSKAHGWSFLDAPVSGGTKGAEAGNLAIMVGGEAAIVEDMRFIFEAMGRPVHVGPSGSGMLCKLANQTIVAVTISAVAEATLLAEKGGADPVALRAALKGGFADSVVLQQHGERMSEGNFTPGGLSKFQLKDLDNTLAEAASLGLALPTTQEVRNRFAHFCEEMGGADLDHSGLYLELKKRNDLT